MGKDVTSDLLDSGRNNNHASAVSRAVESLQGGDPKLKVNGASRNHILADSRIRQILSTAITSLDKLDSSRARNDDHDHAMGQFFRALAGPDEGNRLHGEFNEAHEGRDGTALDDVTERACVGRDNLRLGNADANGDISNQFDPIIVDGAFSENSARIDTAVRNLAAQNIISPEIMIDALSLAKDRRTHQDLSSSVITSGREFDQITRAVLDPFARPASASVRRASFSEGSNRMAEPPAVAAPAREFHHTLAPGAADLFD